MSAPVRARALSAKSHRARVAISCSFWREVLIQSVTSKPSGWAGSRTYTVRPRPSRRLLLGFACRAPEGILADGAPALECDRVAVVLGGLDQDTQDDDAVGLTQAGFD